MSDSTSADLILGTAGHIDHGKSALVLALTGTDPDRLSEEKTRGITIELGFAQVKLDNGVTMGVVDVPGHERFVRQMIAGSTGIDVALLCIAADDGIMPQTEEHLSVLQLLGVPTCVVALTKIDLVDEEWVQLITEEIQNRLATTPYAAAPIVPVSSRTGAGLQELKAALQEVAQSARRVHVNTITRMPVDRVFTIKGVGTVVTGTLWSGQVAIDDQLELLPHAVIARVRSIQEHNLPVDVAHAGNRVALNLVGLTTEDVRPGDFLATPGSVQPTDRFDATLTYLGFQGWERPLETGSRVHVAHGTREVIGRVLLMDGQPELAQGETALVQVRLDDPLPVLWRDRFVIRSFSPVHVVGGGTVLNAHPRRRTTLTDTDRALLNALDADDVPAIADAAFAFSAVPVNAHDLAAISGLDRATCEEQLRRLVESGKARRLPGSGNYVASSAMVQKMTAAIERELIHFHGKNPDALGISKEELRKRLMPHGSSDAFDGLIAYAVEQGKAEVADGKISHPQAGAGSKQRGQEAADRLLALLQEAGSTPPTVAELIAAADLDASRGHSALRLLENQGSIIKVGKEFYFTADTLSQMEHVLRDLLSHGPAPVAALRDVLGVSRKYAIPVLEYFDARGVTRRVGDERELVS